MNGIYILILFLVGFVSGFGGIYLRGTLTRDVKILLAFSGAYLFGLTVLHLLPDIFADHNHDAGYFILLGFILQLVMEYFSKGIEHGHIHHHDTVQNSFPLGIFLSLLLHSFIEGLPLSGGHEMMAHQHHHGHGNELLLGIAIHKIPEAMALAALLYHTFSSKKKVMLYLAIYALATPVGILAGNYLAESGFGHTTDLYNILLSIAVGIFLHVSTTILFEADQHHLISWRKAVAILLGLGLVLIV